jgi:uncharacterized membrane protein YgaE (UPF0421/DUF939 family)
MSDFPTPERLPRAIAAGLAVILTAWAAAAMWLLTYFVPATIDAVLALPPKLAALSPWAQLALGTLAGVALGVALIPRREA